MDERKEVRDSIKWGTSTHMSFTGGGGVSYWFCPEHKLSCSVSSSGRKGSKSETKFKIDGYKEVYKTLDEAIDAILSRKPRVAG